MKWNKQGCLGGKQYMWGECARMYLYDGVWLQAWTQQKVGTGESNQAPQGVQEDLNSSIITESQAVAMSPDCRVPMELSLFLSLLLALSFSSFCLPLSLTLFLAVGIAAD